MALPIIIPAAEGAAALAGAIGLTAAAGLTSSKPSWYKPEPLPISPQQKLELAKFIATHGLPKKTNVVSIPSADNALVLRPEYRTEVVPVTYNDFIMESRLGDAWGVLRGKKKVAETESNGSKQEDNTPKEDPKNNDKKPFWKSGLGKAVKWTGGIAGTALAAPHIWNLGSWYFMDYVPSQIQSRNQESTKSNEPEYIKLTEEELKKLERLTK